MSLMQGVSGDSLRGREMSAGQRVRHVRAASPDKTAGVEIDFSDGETHEEEFFQVNGGILARIPSFYTIRTAV